MKVLQPAGSAAASGSSGGTTASRNRYGAYFRVKSIPVNPQSSLQTSVRSTFSQLVASWSLLTTAQRAAWATYANSVPRTDVFGNTIVLTGRDLYIGCNSLRVQAGLSVVSDGPTTLTLPLLTEPTITVSEASGISMAYDNTDGWAGEVGGGLLLFSSRPKSPQTNYCRGPYRFVGYEAGAGTPPTSPKVFATPPYAYTEGQRVFTKAVAVMADGRISAAAYGSSFCAA